MIDKNEFDESKIRKDDFHIYMLMGQSNMAGFDVIRPEDRLTHPRVFSLNYHFEWELARHPLHMGGGTGLGLSFAMETANADDSITVGLVPCAVNGTQLSMWEKGGPLYHNAVRRAKLAMEKGTMKGILWHQGESDSYGNMARTYGDRFAQMISDFRNDLGDDKIPVVVGKLGLFFEEEEHDAEIVNEFLENVHTQVPLSSCVSSDGLGHTGDYCHFNSESLCEFGVRYFTAMQELQKSK